MSEQEMLQQVVEDAQEAAGTNFQDDGGGSYGWDYGASGEGAVK
jgi:hypothetical protein